MGNERAKKTIKRLTATLLTAAVSCLSILGASMMPNFAISRAQEQAQQAHTQAKQSLTTAPLNGTERQEPETDKLVIPTSYEQYLHLASPMDAAITDDYTAIADGNVIYVYDRFSGEYLTYEHQANATLAMNQVTQLEFSDSGDLYFIDGAPYLHVLERSKLTALTDQATTATNTKFTCSAFALNGNTIYTAHLSNSAGNLSYTTLDKLDTLHSKNLVEFKSSSKPTLTYYEDYVYYTHGSNLLRIDPYLQPSTPETVCGFENTVESLTISQGEVFITDMVGNFYSYNLSQLEYEHHSARVTPNAKDERGGYKSLSLYEDSVYAVRGQSVRKYKVGDGFESYEISADSDAENRLSGAKDTLLLNETLYVADHGNSRISILNTSDGSYSTVPTPDRPNLIAATGKSYAAANQTTVWLYDGDAETPFVFDGFNGNLVGIEGVYGKYYLVTDTNHYYVIEYLPLENPDEPSETPIYAWQKTGGKEKTKKLTPTLLTSDVYGNLYVAAVSGDLYKHTETGFTDPNDHGKEICSTLPAGATVLLVDLNENVYALQSNALYAYAYNADSGVCAYTPTIHPLAKNLVYGQTADTPITSIAFDVKSTVAYVTYSGNLTIATWALPLSTVQSIETQSIEKEIFSNKASEFKVVETSANAFLIEFSLDSLHDLTATEGLHFFPHLSHGRATEQKTALYLGSAGEYSVLAIFDKATHEYGNYLTKTRYYVREKSESEYLVNYAAGEEKIGYLTNGLPLYKYPYLTDLLQVTTLTKNQAIRLIGEINDLDYSYYKVEIRQENGELQTGFIPKPYVTLFDGTPKESETQTYGESRPSGDSLWRLTYLLLGTAAICILLDLLILRRPKDE